MKLKSQTLKLKKAIILNKILIKEAVTEILYQSIEIQKLKKEEQIHLKETILIIQKYLINLIYH